MPTATSSSQPYLSLNATLAAGDTVQVKSGETLLASFIVPDKYGSLSPGDAPDMVPGDRPADDPGDMPDNGAGNGPGGMPDNGAGNGPGGPGGNWSGSSSVLITCPDLEAGNTYTVIFGSTSFEVTAQE